MPREPAGPFAGIRIEPLDPLLFGDNRAARAGLDHLQADQDPSPLTIHGALGRMLAGDSDSNWPDKLLGPRQADVLRPEAEIAELCGWCLEGDRGLLLFPRPLSLRCRRRRSGALEGLDLLEPSKIGEIGSSAGLDLLVLAMSEEEEHEGPVWLSEEALADALTGVVPAVGLYDEAEHHRREPRPGIAVDTRRGTVYDGYFFTRPYRRFRPGELDPARTCEPGLRAWLHTLEPLGELPAGREIGFLGGDRRRARFSLVEHHPRRSEILATLRRRIEDAAPASRGFCLYLLTPAVVTGEGPLQPAGLEPLVAAVAGKPRFTSGWDVRLRQPRELRVLIPEGSVLFFDWPAAADRVSLIRERWLAPVGETGAAAGFGRALVGLW